LLLSHTCRLSFELCIWNFASMAHRAVKAQSSKYKDQNGYWRILQDRDSTIFMLQKNRWRQRETYREHTSRHTSPEDGDARHSRKATALSSGRLPAFIQRLHANVRWSFSQIGTSIVKKQKERALSLPGKLPAPYKTRDFSLRFGSGSPLPRINAWCNGYLWTLVRVYRQINWRVNPAWRSDTRHAWRPWVAV